MTDELIIRADADSYIGIGHVIRCLALSQAWNDCGGRSTFIAARLSQALRAMLEKEGINVHVTGASPGSQNDVQITRRLIQRSKASWVAIDGYHFGASFQSKLKSNDYRLLFIDDNGHAEHYSADIILNQNLHAAGNLYKNKEGYTKLLLGPQFSLLRRQFTKPSHADRQIAYLASRVLVTMGGGDQNNTTLRVIKAIMGIGSSRFNTKVVIGQTNPHLNTIVRQIDNTDGNFTILKNVMNMSELMGWADLAVSGGGSTCWEMACVGLPAIVLTTFNNQKYIANRLNEKGVVVSCGWHEDVEDTKISEAIQELSQSHSRRVRMSKKGKEMIDGQGAFRVVQTMIN
jgi:UDP-2,4-diacetamido-2,4,6-trideoxy-beta-L-altropyranose hydrolase